MIFPVIQPENDTGIFIRWAQRKLHFVALQERLGEKKDNAKIQSEIHQLPKN